MYTNENGDPIIRDSFVFYRSFYEQIKHLEDPTLITYYIKCLCEYAFNAQEIDETLADKQLERTERQLLDVAYVSATPQIDANNKRYEDGKKGGRPSKIDKTEKLAEKMQNGVAYWDLTPKEQDIIRRADWEGIQEYAHNYDTSRLIDIIKERIEK